MCQPIRSHGVLFAHGFVRNTFGGIWGVLASCKVSMEPYQQIRSHRVVENILDQTLYMISMYIFI